MKFAHDVIRKPVITERSMSGLAENKYVFEVAPNAEIGRASCLVKGLCYGG